MKYHSKMMFLRCVSFFLFAVMTVLLYPVGTLALTVEEESAIAEGSVITNDQQTVQSQPIEGGTEAMVPALGPGEKSLLELQSMKVEDVERPEVVSLQAAMEKQHVNRLYAQEEALNTVMFQNRDGSTTTYIYTVPVKYVSEDGNIKDKSTAITASTAEASYAYAMEQNDVKVYFGNARMSGVKVAHGEYSVTMKPVSSASAQPTVTPGGNTALYEGVFGEGTAISYKTQLSGVKEDIVLYSNVGKNSFSFTLTTDGLTPALIDGVWCLLDARDATLMKLGEIFITDSAGNTTLGSMSIEANVKFGNYTLTVTAPQEFLDADTTVYPVYVDPTITIISYFLDDHGVEHETIADMGRYETQSDADAALADPAHHVLKNNFSEIFYVFPDFYMDYGRDVGVYGIEECDIGNVSLHLYMEPGDACTITAKPLNYDLWFFGELPAPIAVYEPNIANMSENANVGVTSVPAATAWATYEIDITEIARGWARYMQGDSTNDYENPANGFVLSSDGATARKIKSVEANPVWTYYTVDHENGGYVYLRNATTYKFLTTFPSNNGLSVSNSYVDDSILQFVYRGGGKYFIKMGSNPNLFLCSTTDANFSSGVCFTEAPKSLTDPNYLWRTLSGADGGVIIQNVATGKVIFDSPTGISMVEPRTINTSVSFDSNYHQTVWYPVNLDMFEPITSFTALVPEWVEVNATVGLSIIPTPIDAMWTSDVHFQCTSSDPSVIQVNTDGSMTAVGAGYAVITVQHKAFKVQDTCVVTVGKPLEDGLYVVKNAFSKKYMEIENASTNNQAIVQQALYHGREEMRWKIQYTSDGYYTIQSANSEKYLALATESTAHGIGIVQTDTLSDAAKWRILGTVNGNYQLKSMCAESTNMCISMLGGSSLGGIDLIQTSYSASGKRCDWVISQVKFLATVNNYYDNGYGARHGLTTAETVEYIHETSIEVAEMYLSIYGLLLEINQPQYFASDLDTICKGTVTAQNVTEDCTHNGGEHMLRNSVLSDFRAGVQAGVGVTNILWTGHKVVSTGYDELPKENRSCSSGSVIMLLQKDRYLQTGTLLHELGHQYGAPDHYHEANEDESHCKNELICSDCPINPRPRECAMYDNDYLFCTPCYEDVLSYLSEHNYGVEE